MQPEFATPSPSRFEALLETLADQGWVVTDDLIDAELCRGLYDQCRHLWGQGHFRQAGIGHGPSPALDTEIRGDSICWIEDQEAKGAASQFLDWTESLQEELNQHFYLGLKRTEFHFARYPVDGGYRKHMDQHRGQTGRKISLVLYLNPVWEDSDEGQLCLYSPDEERLIHRVLPQGGRLVLFRSDLIPHEVLPARQVRWSVTGWFRSDEADPVQQALSRPASGHPS